MGDTRLGLRLLFWGAGARTGAHFALSGWYRGERRFVPNALHIESFRDAFEWFVPAFLQLAVLAASTVMVIGAWRMAAAARGRARIYLWSAAGALAGALAGAMLARLPSTIFTLRIFERSFIPERVWGILAPLGLLLFMLGILALLAGMLELAREAKAPIPWIAGGVLAGLWILETLYWVVLMHWTGFLRGNWWDLLFSVVDLAEIVLLLALIDGLANAVETPKSAPADWAQNAGWPLAADGLRSYRTALLCRIFLPVGALLLVLMAVGMRVFALAATAAIATPFLVVLFSVWMLVGIQRFASYVPKESEARTSAGVAAKLMIASAIFDALGLCILLLVLVDRHAMENGQETSQAMGSTAQLMGVIGMFILLGAFRRVGQFVGVKDAGRRVRIVAIMTGVSAALLTQLPLGAEEMRRALDYSFERSMAFLVVGLVLLVAGIWALVVYVGLLGRLRDAMAPAIPRSAL